jgi:hypothetical protein
MNYGFYNGDPTEIAPSEQLKTVNQLKITLIYYLINYNALTLDHYTTKFLIVV